MGEDLQELLPRSHSLSAEEMGRVFGGRDSCGTTGDTCGKDRPDCCDGYSWDGRDECRDDDSFAVGP